MASIVVADVLPLIEKLTERGVAIRIAAQLVAEHDVAAIEAQILALEHRKPRDPAATLVTAIRENWSPPVTLLDVLEQQKKKTAREAAERAQRAYDNERVTRLELTRLDALRRLDLMPLAERAVLEARARAEVRERTAWFVASDSVVFSKMVAAKMVAVLVESGSASSPYSTS